MLDFRRIQLFHGPLAMNLAFHVGIVIVAGKLHHTATALPLCMALPLLNFGRHSRTSISLETATPDKRASVRHTTVSMTNSADRVEIIGSAPSALDSV